MAKKQNWWNLMKNPVFIKFHQFRCLPFLVSKNEFFFEIVFGGDFFWIDFLGRDASSEIVW